MRILWEWSKRESAKDHFYEGMKCKKKQKEVEVGYFERIFRWTKL